MNTAITALSAILGSAVDAAADVLPIVDVSVPGAAGNKKILVSQLFAVPSQTLVTPILGVAAATSVNKVTITAPATSAVLTIADGKTFTNSNTLTLTATDGSTLAIGTGGTLGTAAYTAATAYATLGANTFTALQTITQASANAGIVASTGYSLTGSDATNMLDFAGATNTSGNAIIFKFAISNTAWGASGKFASWLAGASGTTEVFSVAKSGAVQSALGSAAACSFSFIGDPNTGIYSAGADNLQIITGGAPNLALDINGITAMSATSPPTNFFLANNCLLAFGVAGTKQAYLGPSTTAVLQQGQANAAVPVAQTLQAQGSRAGTDSNVGGANYTLSAGIGTGTGTLSALILASPIAVASGSGAQTVTTGLAIKAGTAVLTSYTVANLPAAATAGAGATAFVTDASTTLILGLGGAVTGGGANKVPVYSDGTNWIYG